MCWSGWVRQKCQGFGFVFLFSDLLKVMTEKYFNQQGAGIVHNPPIMKKKIGSAVKAMQMCVHTMFEDCREHINKKTKPTPGYFTKF